MSWKRINDIFLAFICGLLIGYCWNEPRPVKIPDPEIIIRDSIVRDSIFIINDSIKTEILYLEQKYDKETSTIMSSSDSVNFEFFTRYLEDYKRTVTSN